MAARAPLTARVRRFVGRALVGAASVLGLAFGAHVAVNHVSELEPPAVARPPGEVRVEGGVRRFGASFARVNDGLLEVHLRGDPVDIGYAQTRLLHPEMVENEGILLESFTEAVPSRVLRLVLLDLAQWRYRGLDAELDPARRAEIAASALGFDPDPYTAVFPTYQRFVYLNALYDIALSFEHSPLVGCTTFAFSRERSEHGGTLLARAFDFEIEIFDRKKAVFFVEETGKIPFASVAWPGLVGVVSGLNRAGVAVVVHGGRAGQSRTTGEPVVHALRRVLGSATSTEQALRELSRREPLVSHLLVLSDAQGHAVRVERVPGSPDHVLPLGDARAVTNHFAGPAAEDPKNRAVIAGTSTVDRKRRADELVARAPERVGAVHAVELLRDRKAVGDQPLPLGDRRAIDALIAAHGVVMDTRTRTLWVSQAPHLLGRFVAFELERVFAAADATAGGATAPAPVRASLPPDPLLTSGEYARFRAKR